MSFDAQKQWGDRGRLAKLQKARDHLLSQARQPVSSWNRDGKVANALARRAAAAATHDTPPVRTKPAPLGGTPSPYIPSSDIRQLLESEALELRMQRGEQVSKNSTTHLMPASRNAEVQNPVPNRLARDVGWYSSRDAYNGCTVLWANPDNAWRPPPTPGYRATLAKLRIRSKQDQDLVIKAALQKARQLVAEQKLGANSCATSHVAANASRHRRCRAPTLQWDGEDVDDAVLDDDFPVEEEEVEEDEEEGWAQGLLLGAEPQRVASVDAQPAPGAEAVAAMDLPDTATLIGGAATKAGLQASTAFAVVAPVLAAVEEEEEEDGFVIVGPLAPSCANTSAATSTAAVASTSTTSVNADVAPGNDIAAVAFSTPTTSATPAAAAGTLSCELDLMLALQEQRLLQLQARLVAPNMMLGEECEAGPMQGASQALVVDLAQLVKTGRQPRRKGKATKVQPQTKRQHDAAAAAAAENEEEVEAFVLV